MTPHTLDSASAWDNCLGSELAFAVSLPLGPTGAEITDQGLAARLLDALAVVESALPSLRVDDKPQDACARLELKLDLLMHLLGNVLSERLPPARPARLSPRGLVLAAGVISARDNRLAIYPSPQLPLPLVLGIDGLECRGDACGARWMPLDPVLRDALGRWIFRLHRREIARRRQPPAAGDSGLEPG
ncbi:MULTISPECIES: PilZ domain-containing protein [Thiorhodovibrio]|uniref:PilZ domain-containing protein n=1 Tax=Thiorhodovibrio TaxID=61593 RepID=UPI0019120254|nr:PilZ domain-containing protein [Thiorhodovibrio litoralis]